MNKLLLDPGLMTSYLLVIWLIRCCIDILKNLGAPKKITIPMKQAEINFRISAAKSPLYNQINLDLKEIFEKQMALFLPERPIDDEPDHIWVDSMRRPEETFESVGKISKALIRLTDMINSLNNKKFPVPQRAIEQLKQAFNEMSTWSHGFVEEDKFAKDTVESIFDHEPYDQ